MQPFGLQIKNGLGSINSVLCDYLLTENKSNFCNQGLLMCCGHRPQYFNSQYPLKLFQAAITGVLQKFESQIPWLSMTRSDKIRWIFLDKAPKIFHPGSRVYRKNACSVTKCWVYPQDRCPSGLLRHMVLVLLRRGPREKDG